MKSPLPVFVLNLEFGGAATASNATTLFFQTLDTPGNCSLSIVLTTPILI